MQKGVMALIHICLTLNKAIPLFLVNFQVALNGKERKQGAQ